MEAAEPVRLQTDADLRFAPVDAAEAPYVTAFSSDWYQGMSGEAMTLQNWADVSVVVQGIFLPLSILILIWQVQKQSKLTRAANAQALVEIASPFNLALVQDATMAGLWKQGASRYSEMEPVEQERYLNMLIWWFLLHENIHHQWQEDLIDKAIYNSWQRDLEYFIAKHRIADRWPSLKEFYHVDFARHVDGIIERQQHERIARVA